jgi:hypothetical protein
MTYIKFNMINHHFQLSWFSKQQTSLIQNFHTLWSIYWNIITTKKYDKYLYYGLLGYDTIVWYVVTCVSLGPTASIFREEDGGSKYLNTVGNHNKSEKCPNSHHNLNLHYHKKPSSQAKNPFKMQLDKTEWTNKQGSTLTTKTHSHNKYNFNFFIILYFRPYENISLL